jgi:ABC-type Fe3+/spermidine/putrescine transport system ATPase subunit
MTTQAATPTFPNSIPEETDNALDVAGVTKRFGEVTALGDVSLRVPAGAFFSLLGPSGCGKTTLLRIIAGLEEPDSGRVSFGGREITRLPPERRPFNIVFQSYALFPHMTVRDNVAFGLTTSRRNRIAAFELRRRVDQMLELVGLAGYAERRPSELSGGQAQRVAVARALVREPALLLLDEPLSALDRNVRHALREELLRIHRELGTTFLLVTHDQDEALSMSQYVALMNHGRFEQVGTAEALYRQPQTLFAARFIGAGTFISTEVKGRADDRVLVEIAGRTTRAYDASVGDAKRVQVLLRPEDLRIAAPPDGVEAVVETCAFFGSYYAITARGSLGTVRAHVPEALAPGAGVRISWPEAAGIAYPESTPEGDNDPRNSQMSA